MEAEIFREIEKEISTNLEKNRYFIIDKKYFSKFFKDINVIDRELYFLQFIKSLSNQYQIIKFKNKFIVMRNGH